MIEFFFRVGPWLVIVPLLIALMGFKKASLSYRIIFWYLVASTVSQIIAFSLWYRSMNNMPVGHIYTILEFGLLGYFYRSLIQSRFYKKLIIYIITGFTLFSLINLFFLQSIFEFNSYPASLCCFFMIVFAFIFIVKSSTLITSKDSLDFSTLSIINSGFLIYFSGSLILFAGDHYLQNETRNIYMTVWSLHLFLLDLLYIFLTVGLSRNLKS